MEGYDRRYTFWQGYRNAMNHLSDEQELSLRRAIDAFAFDSEVPEFDEPILALAWELIVPSLDKSLKQSQGGLKGKAKSMETVAKRNSNNPNRVPKLGTHGATPLEVEEEKEMEKERTKKLLSFYGTTETARSN